MKCARIKCKTDREIFSNQKVGRIRYIFFCGFKGRQCFPDNYIEQEGCQQKMNGPEKCFTVRFWSRCSVSVALQILNQFKSFLSLSTIQELGGLCDRRACDS